MAPTSARYRIANEYTMRTVLCPFSQVAHSLIGETNMQINTCNKILQTLHWIYSTPRVRIKEGTVALRRGRRTIKGVTSELYRPIKRLSQ
jgi:hypothetical protein